MAITIAKPGGKFSRDGSVGGIRLAEDILSELVDAVEALGGSITWPAVVQMPTGSGNGLEIHFTSTSTGEAIIIYDHNGAPIIAIPAAGGPKVFGDHIGACAGVFGPEISFDGATNPPSIQMGDATAQTGHRFWFGAGAPNATWVAGVTQPNDLWYDTVHAIEYGCISGGSGTSAGTWIVRGPFGGQQNYNAVSANFTNTSAAGGAFQSAAATSGTAPTITLPNDGRTYRVEFLASYWKSSTSGQCEIGIGTSVSNVLACSQIAGLSAIASPIPPLVIPQLVGSGQTLSIYTQAATTGWTITVGAAAGPGAVTPASLAAYRVA